MSPLSRRGLFAFAAALAAMSAAPHALAGAGPTGDHKGFIRIRIDATPLLPTVRELTELLPLAADLGDAARASLVELFEEGGRFFQAVYLDQNTALGARERLICLQPSKLLLLCVSALARHGQGNPVHQSHIGSSVGRLATPTLEGRAFDHKSERGQSLARAA